jgi:hypothetical protein
MTRADHMSDKAVLDRHDVSFRALEFTDFWKARREKIKHRLTTLWARGADLQRAAAAN